MKQPDRILIRYQSTLLTKGDSMNRSERFTITLEAKPDDRPAVIRLRRLLKFAWRTCRLKCVKVSEERKTQN